MSGPPGPILDTVLRMSKWKWSVVDGRTDEAFSWPVMLLGSDKHGTWLGSRRGNPVRQPTGDTEAQRDDLVWLIDEDAWWLPAFWFNNATDLTIDICSP